MLAERFSASCFESVVCIGGWRVGVLSMLG